MATLPRLSCVVLATGDSDFSHLYVHLRKCGCYIVGVGPHSVLSEIVKTTADKFVYTDPPPASPALQPAPSPPAQPAPAPPAQGAVEWVGPPRGSQTREIPLSLGGKQPCPFGAKCTFGRKKIVRMLRGAGGEMPGVCVCVCVCVCMYM